MRTCVIIGLAGSVLSLLFPTALVKVFTTDTDLLNIGRVAIQFLMVMFPLIGFTIVNSNFFQSIDKPWIAIVTSLSRQVLFLLPLSFLVPLLFVRLGHNGLTGIWAACTISDIIGAMLAAALLYSQRKVFRKQ